MALNRRADLIANPQYAEALAASKPPGPAVDLGGLANHRRLKILLSYSHFDYGVRRRGISYETTAFRDPLFLLGHDVVEAPVDIIRDQFGHEAVSEALLELAFRHAVDLVFTIPQGFEPSLASLRQVRDVLGIPVVAWFSDDHWRFEDFTSRFLPSISVAVTTSALAYPRYGARGFTRVIQSQWSVNHRIFRPLDLSLVYDLSFVGQPHADRRALVRDLRRNGFKVVTRGFGWPEGRASLREMVELWSQSKLCLNFSNASRDRVNQIKGRDFEIPAVGRPLVTAHSDEIGQYFTENEVATYRSPADLMQILGDLLNDEQKREAIATAGYQRVLAEHTAEKRLTDLISKLIAKGWLRS